MVIFRFLYNLPLVWSIVWGMTSLRLLLYTHYEDLRKLTRDVAENKIDPNTIGYRYSTICMRLRRFSKAWGWTIMYLLFGLLFTLISNFFDILLGQMGRQTDRQAKNIIAAIGVGVLLAVFLRYVAGLNDEHDDFVTIVSLKHGLGTIRCMSGSYLAVLYKMRGRVMAGAMPITMGLFGTLVSIVSVVVSFMLVQTGITIDKQFKCAEYELNTTMVLLTELSAK